MPTAARGELLMRLSWITAAEVQLGDTIAEGTTIGMLISATGVAGRIRFTLQTADGDVVDLEPTTPESYVAVGALREADHRVTNTIGSICSGYGGLDLGIEAIIPSSTLWVADYEPPTDKIPNPKNAPSIILAHRYPGVPNLGDITAVNWTSVPRPTIVSGGTPCQDVSAAGARRGMRAGTRSGIWASMVDAIETHRPTLVVWENVRGALSAAADSNMEPCPICLGDERDCNLRALGRVLGDLADIGYDTAWIGLPASDVGAPHARYRVFVLGWPARDADRLGQVRPGPAWRRRPGSTYHDRLDAVALGDGPGVEVVQPGKPHTDWGDFGAAVRRWERTLGRPAPAPTERSARGGMVLAPRFVEWMMGLDPGWVTDVPGLTRNDQLKALGNGVVPQQAAEAIRRLLPHVPEVIRAQLGV